MQHIDAFLHKKNIFPELLKKEMCAQILLDESGCRVSVTHIFFSGKKVVLKITPNEKILVLFNKKNILERFKKIPSLTFYTDIS